jgi:hypothetical protein
MKKLILILILGSIILSIKAFPYQKNNNSTMNTIDSVFLLFPMKIGNKWIYNYGNHEYGQPFGNLVMNIVDSSVKNGHIYYLFNSQFYGQIHSYCDTGPLLIGNSYYLRIDSTTGNLMKYTPDYGCFGIMNEILIDSLSASLNDSIKMTECQYKVICEQVNQPFLFGEQRISKTFSWYDWTYFRPPFRIKKYLTGIGPYYGKRGQYITYCVFQLKGSIINDIVYGDTNLVSIHTISDIIPEDFSLSQNYPNPFNPTTNIKFSLPTTQYTILKIFDIAGREVATLVNEKLQAGEYEFKFDANGLSSGVYFYQLRADEFVKTRKMVLTK